MRVHACMHAPAARRVEGMARVGAWLAFWSAASAAPGRQLGHPAGAAKDSSCGASGGAPSCNSWCQEEFADQHCSDCQCSACGFCATVVPCTPLPFVNDISVQACQGFCNEQNKAQHCNRCACQKCDFCFGASSLVERDVDCHIGQCSAFCDSMYKGQHCDRCDCKACSFCHEEATSSQCKPLNDKDISVRSCQLWCASEFKEIHCAHCACQACDFCPPAPSPPPSPSPNPQPPLPPSPPPPPTAPEPDSPAASPPPPTATFPLDQKIDAASSVASSFGIAVARGETKMPSDEPPRNEAERDQRLAAFRLMLRSIIIIAGSALLVIVFLCIRHPAARRLFEQAVKGDKQIVSAADDDSDEDADDPSTRKKRNTRAEKGGSSKKKLSAGKEIKAYFDLDGVVHTVRVSTKNVHSTDEFKERLLEAVVASSAPELRNISLDEMQIDLLDANNKKHALDHRTQTETLRSAKAVRIH